MTKILSADVSGGETVPENVTDSPGCAGLGEILSVNEIVADTGEIKGCGEKVAPIIMSSIIERAIIPMNLNL
jgi:hypothetical protein